MIRTLAASTILGALTAGIGGYTINSPPWQTVIGSSSGGPEQTADIVAAIEKWPICSAMAEALNVSAKYTALPNEYVKVRSEFAAAISPVASQTYGLGHAPTPEEISAINVRN